MFTLCELRLIRSNIHFHVLQRDYVRFLNPNYEAQSLPHDLRIRLILSSSEYEYNSSASRLSTWAGVECFWGSKVGTRSLLVASPGNVV